MFKILIKIAVMVAIMSPMGLVAVSRPAEAGASASAPSKYGTPEHTARMLASRGVLLPNQNAWISAQVRGINALGQVEVSHVAVKSKGIRMPAMTMTFAVADPAQVSKLKHGQRVEIEVANVAGAATVINWR